MNFWKYPGERFEIAMDFSVLLGPNEIIQNAAVAAYDPAGQDVSAMLLDGGTKNIDGSSVKIHVRAGTAGESYKIIFQADTNVPQIFIEKALCSVREE